MTEEAAEPVETEEAAETPEPAVDEEPAAPVTVPLDRPCVELDEVTGTETLTDTEAREANRSAKSGLPGGFRRLP